MSVRDDFRLNRRALIGAMGGLGALGMTPLSALARPQDAGKAAETYEELPLDVGGRTTTLTIARPQGVPKALALFSTGFGSWPARYHRLFDVLNAQGFVVLAPLHVDSMHYPDRDKFGREAGFTTRFEDMHAASDYGARAFGGLRTMAAGHSFGSLTALGLGGALAKIAPFRDARVKSVLAFSTPGKIPGLIGPDAYASVAVPMFEITGTKDQLPEGIGYPSEPGDHLLPVETAGSDAYGLVVKDADHGLVDTPELFAHAAPAVTLFVQGYGRDHEAAREALKHWQAPEGDRFIVRGGEA